MDRKDWVIEQEKRKILQEEMVTEMKKNKFINEIKNGLGEKIKKEPNTVFKKPSLLTKIKKIFGWN
tara:strand:+ start:123 stop:320 length:198 start_codon:yes stop_codon:yes gene_type:complete